MFTFLSRGKCSNSALTKVRPVSFRVTRDLVKIITRSYPQIGKLVTGLGGCGNRSAE